MAAPAYDPSQRIIDLTRGDLEQLLATGIAAALLQLEEKKRADQRLTSNEAAGFLGCTTAHLQKLHKRGLPYEKGSPNRYRQGDLEAYRATTRLGN